MSGSAAWDRALRALSLLAIDPEGLRGLHLLARAGPVRQRFETMLATLPGPARRIHPDLSDTALFGGADIAATLAEGRLIWQEGLATQPARLVLPMAERTQPHLAARLAQLLDRAAGHGLILLDEGAEEAERAPEALIERLAFGLDLEETGWHQAQATLPAPADLDAARARLSGVRIGPDHIATLTALAARFGIDSLRAPLLALRAARALAALEARATPNDDDLREAAELVFAHRATQIPQEEEAEPQDDTPPPDPETDSADTEETQDCIPDDLLIDAVAALVPPGLMERLQNARSTRGMRGAGAGARRKGNRRGRPLPSRPGKPDGRARIDIVATLRNAAPWQPLRRQDESSARVIIHPSDIRLRRFETRSDRLLIFAVDASGSAAMARLAEAKGAVELLLAQAYARRDHVALIAFRGTGAELLLPPTRSLVQAKRRLAGLPGGGGTPLAAGLLAGATLAAQARGRGLDPALALLTDGRANVALDGSGGRAAAMQEAHEVSAYLRALGLPAILIDTSARSAPETAQLAQSLGAQYLALPRADAARISGAVSAALDAPAR
ncbi:MAG: magnesium chelatase subunit D [Roseovarius sp.]|uniref:magnesium chelatase subunit D n=1 Tax=Roseovarius sp. TaxID=1486281 RepID=UPI0032EE7C7C